jgi:hypothetical protein
MEGDFLFFIFYFLFAICDWRLSIFDFATMDSQRARDAQSQIANRK